MNKEESMIVKLSFPPKGVTTRFTNRIRKPKGATIRGGVVRCLCMLAALALMLGDGKDATAQVTDCDVTLSGTIDPVIFQGAIDTTQDLDSDGTVRICLDRGHIYLYDETFQGIRIERDNLEIIGNPIDASGYPTSYLAVYGRQSKGFRVHDVQNFSLKNVLVYVAGTQSTGVAISNSSVDTLSSNFFWIAGQLARGVFVTSSSKISSIADSRFYVYPSQGGPSGSLFAEGIFILASTLDELRNNLFYLNDESNTRAVTTDESRVGRIMNSQLFGSGEGNGFGFSFYLSNIGIVSGLSFENVERAITALGSTIGLIDSVDVQNSGGQPRAIHSRSDSKIHSIRSLHVSFESETVFARGLELHESSVGSLLDFRVTSEGNFTEGISAHNAEVDMVDDFSIDVFGDHSRAIDLLSTDSKQARIGLLSTGAIQTGGNNSIAIQGEEFVENTLSVSISNGSSQ